MYARHDIVNICLNFFRRVGCFWTSSGCLDSVSAMTWSFPGACFATALNRIIRSNNRWHRSDCCLVYVASVYESLEVCGLSTVWTSPYLADTGWISHKPMCRLGFGGVDTHKTTLTMFYRAYTWIPWCDRLNMHLQNPIANARRCYDVQNICK